MGFDDIIKTKSEDHVIIDGIDNNYRDFKAGYKKSEVASIYTDVKIQDGRIKFHFDTVITSDDLVNDIIAMMIKKQMFRLRKYLERE